MVVNYLDVLLLSGERWKGIILILIK